MDNQLTCSICTKTYFYDRKKRSTYDVCGSCMANRHRWHLKSCMVEYKGNKCLLCGYNKYLNSLEFHHIDRESKSINICGNHNRSWESIMKELDKCVLLCKNCHGECERDYHFEFWGHENSLRKEILEKNKDFIPTKISFTRLNWKKHHPKYINDYKD